MTSSPTNGCNKCNGLGAIGSWKFYTDGKFCDCPASNTARGYQIMTREQHEASALRDWEFHRAEAKAARRARRAAAS